MIRKLFGKFCFGLEPGGGGEGEGTPANFGWGCATKVPYLRTMKAKTDTLFKAQSRKMVPYLRKKTQLFIA